MSKCKHCDANLHEGAAFCDNCGKPVRGPSGTIDQVTPMTGLITPDPDQPTGRHARAVATLQSGQTFADRYVIDSVVGRGGMGVVYKAVDKVSGKTIALKLINAAPVGGERAMQRLIGEGVTARDIRHPNVVAVYDVGVSENQPFVAMEYLDGISLRSWHGRAMQRGVPVPLRVAVRIIAEVIDGLKAAHDAGVIHRDLKPENIILLSDPTEQSAPLKLLDFGIARAAGNNLNASSGTGLGTPDYMAPEQRTNPDSVGPSADLYSISIMLYELLVGVVPGRHWQPPSGGRADVPVEVDALILKGMSDNRDMRPQTAAQYRKELVDAVNRIPVVSVKPAEGRTGNRSLVWVGAGVAAFASVVLVGAIAGNSNGGHGGKPDSGVYARDDIDDDGLLIGPVSPQPSSVSSYYSGTWADGSGGKYKLNVDQNGAFSGAGRTGDGTMVDLQGSFGGNTLNFVFAAEGEDIASAQGVQTDQCHFNFQSVNAYGQPFLAGTFHVNHKPGEPCP
jgi:serine/threonine protein kinase